MKRFYKWSAIIAGILFGVGILLVFACFIVGGKRVARGIAWNSLSEAAEAADEVVQDVLGENWHLFWDINEGHTLIEEEGIATELNVNGTVIEAGEYEARLEAADIKNLNLSTGIGYLELKQKDEDDGRIEVQIAGVGSCGYSVTDGTLYVDGFQGISKPLEKMNKMVLSLPKGMTFQEILLETGAGEIKLSGLQTEKLDAQVGAGVLELQNITADNVTAEIGAGSLEAENVKAQDAEIILNVGECIYKGIISGELQAECDMGNMEFTFKDSRLKHNFMASCGVGEIEIEGYGTLAIAGEKEIDNEAESCYDITCNMGSVSMKFEED